MTKVSGLYKPFRHRVSWYSKKFFKMIVFFEFLISYKYHRNQLLPESEMSFLKLTLIHNLLYVCEWVFQSIMIYLIKLSHQRNLKLSNRLKNNPSTNINHVVFVLCEIKTIAIKAQTYLHNKCFGYVYIS